MSKERSAMQAAGRRHGKPHGDRAGTVTLIFAITLVPILMTAGLVFDYGWVLQAKSKLDLAADAAALAAARTAAAGYAAGEKSADYMSQGHDAALEWFTAQAGAVSQAQTFGLQTPSIVQDGANFTVTLSYTASVYEVLPTLFGYTADKNIANIANTVAASIKVNGFATVDFLLDNTSSMMLAATDAELGKLQNAEQQWLNTGYAGATSPAANRKALNGGSDLVGWNDTNRLSISIGEVTKGPGWPVSTLKAWPAGLPAANYCAFACHWSAASTTANPTDYYGVARAAGVQLRFDVVQSATVTAIKEMETAEKVAGQFGVGVFTFGGVDFSQSGYLVTVFPETPIDLTVGGVTTRNAGGDAAIAALNTITPPVSGDIPNTNVGIALDDTLKIAGQGGTGNTVTSPQKSLILVTDGVEDDTHPQSIPSTEGPISPARCNQIKNAGYTLYILYTPYNPAAVYLPNNWKLEPYITGSPSPVQAALQACASSSTSGVIVATSPADIQAGMLALIDAAIGNTTHVTD